MLEREGEPTGLIETWADAGALWLVDAVSSGAEPGTVHRVDASHDELPEQFGGGSTHHFGLGETVAMARALGRLPDRVVVFGIEGEQVRDRGRADARGRGCCAGRSSGRSPAEVQAATER